MKRSGDSQNHMSKNKKKRTVRTENELEAALGSLCKIIVGMATFHLYEQHVHERFKKHEAAIQSVIRNGALDSTLINLRCFNEFFKPGGTDDDVRLHHFTNQTVDPFLTPEEQAQISKYLAHVTIHRADITTKEWDIDRMVAFGLQQGKSFLAAVDQNHKYKDSGTLKEVNDVLSGIDRLIGQIKTQSLDFES